MRAVFLCGNLLLQPRIIYCLQSLAAAEAAQIRSDAIKRIIIRSLIQNDLHLPVHYIEVPKTTFNHELTSPWRPEFSLFWGKSETFLIMYIGNVGAKRQTESCDWDFKVWLKWKVLSPSLGILKLRRKFLGCSFFPAWTSMWGYFPF